MIFSETLEQRVCLSASPTVLADVLAIQTAEQTLVSQRLADIATVRADFAQIGVTTNNIAPAIHNELLALAAQILHEKEQIVADQKSDDQTLASDAAAENRAQVLLKVDQSRGDSAAASSESATLAADQQKLSSDQQKAANTIARDKSNLARAVSNEGQSVRTTAENALALVTAARAKLISDQQTDAAALATDQQNLLDAQQKLIADERA